MEQKTKHTPGLWGLTREDIGFSIRSHHNAQNGYSSEHICEMNNYREDRLQERKANAHLIAAAPEMLEALKELVALQGELNLVDHDYASLAKMNSSFEDALKKARAVISRAEGRDA